MKAIDITNSNSNNLAQSRINTNYWSPLTNLVDELEEEAETKNGTSATSYNIESRVEKGYAKRKERNRTSAQRNERRKLNKKIHKERT